MLTKHGASAAARMRVSGSSCARDAVSAWRATAPSCHASQEASDDFPTPSAPSLSPAQSPDPVTAL
jgi:hypothetical protein